MGRGAWCPMLGRAIGTASASAAQIVWSVAKTFDLAGQDLAAAHQGDEIENENENDQREVEWA